MSKIIKPRLFFVSGTTSPLADGKTRTVVLVASLTSKPEVRNFQSESVNHSLTKKGIKAIQTIVTEVQEVNEYTLSFGLAVTAPADKFDIEVGKSIALGKALKEKSALATIKTDDKFFTKTVIEGMLKSKLKHILEAPDQFIKVSPVKGSGEPA